MKALIRFFLFQFLFLFTFLQGSTSTLPSAGFFMPDSVKAVTLKYRKINNLILLPVVINDSITVNLILDTGCRNLVLFGKRFEKFFNLPADRKVKFSGLGSGRPVYGGLALKNKVSIGAVLGNEIPVIVVPERNVFGSFTNVHGVIGYEIYTKFEIELNPAAQTITFRPATTAQLPFGYTRVPIKIEDSRPLIDCEVIFSSQHSRLCNLMIDTGSSLGLLLKTTDFENYANESSIILGFGFNGEIKGVQMKTNKLKLGDMEITGIDTGIIQSEWHNYASIGMEILKDYSLVLNYCQAYAGFRKI